jgi:hypothetical protein
LFSGGDRVRQILLFIVVVICVLWSACDDTIVEPPINVVKGTVTDSLTRVPIDSAWIDNDTILPHRVYSDSLGYYYFPIGYKGKKSVYCGKDGYITKNKEIIFSGNGMTATMDFELASFTPSQVKEETR